MNEDKLRRWIQTYVVAWGNQGNDMKVIMLKELDKVFEENGCGREFWKDNKLISCKNCNLCIDCEIKKRKVGERRT